MGGAPNLNGARREGIGVTGEDTRKRIAQVGLWSSEKLDTLRCYLGGQAGRGGFLPATRRAAERYYIDLFAGPGENRIRETGQTIDGSPLVALKAGPPQFTHLFWVDAERRNGLSLQAHSEDYPRKKITVLVGDANEKIDDILQLLPRHFPVFAFLDPEGAELHWETVRRLAEHKAPGQTKVELFILFAYNQGLVRLLPHDPSKMVHEQALDRVMPNPEGWRRVYRSRLSGQAGPFQIRREMLNEYVQGLVSLGYAFVPPPKLVPRPQGQPLYFLIFASDHPAGDRIMSWCLEHVRSTRIQASFLGYEEQY